MAQIFHWYPIGLLGLGVAAAVAAGPWPLVVVAWLLLGHAVLELLTGTRFGQPDARQGADPVNEVVQTAPLIAVVVAVFAVVACGLWTISAGGLAVYEIIGIGVMMGFATGAFGITTAHELVHRRSFWQRQAGVALLLLTHIPHFRIEHVHNHHPLVGTPKDPATARLGESVYVFAVRSIAGQYLSAWRLETVRLARRKQGFWSVHNRMLVYAVCQVALYAAVYLAFGWIAFLVFMAQGLLAMWLLETVNYIEHYGLRRREVAPGEWEPYGPNHAWNSGHPVTNFALFNLGRHGAHHQSLLTPYPGLANPAAEPQLPTGYAGAVILAMAPPLWRRVMDGRAEAVNARA